jgi:hypothetical protein
MIEASCHCCLMQIEISRKPRTLTSCNGSICRRTAALWAYYSAADVRVRAHRGTLSAYVWGGQRIRFMRCQQCGCLTHWVAAKNPGSSRMGVNTRNVVDPDILKDVRIRHLDGARTWKFLDQLHL